MASFVAGTLTTVGAGNSGSFNKDFNISVWGTFTGTIRPERSFDSGLTWLPYTYIDGSALSWTAAFSTTIPEPENGVQWRLYATAMSGTANYRLSQ